MKKFMRIFLFLLTVMICCVAYSQTNAVLVQLDGETKNLLREATADSWFKKDAFTSALLGGLTAVAAAWFAYRWQRCKEQEADDEFNMRVLKAIEIELRTLAEIYDSGAAGKIKDLKEGEAFRFWFHFSQNHFVIYESNASHIGKIDPNLAGRIVRLHELIKVMIEDFGVNSRYVADLDQTNWALRFNPTDRNLLERQQWILSLMANQAKDMKALDARIHEESKELFKRFDELKCSSS